jgi:tight adherence protein C
MNRQALLLVLLILLLLLMAVASVPLLRQIEQERRFAARLQAIRLGGADRLQPQSAERRPGAAGLVLGLGNLVARSGVLSQRTVDALQQTLTVAGLRGPGALGMLVGTKLLLFVLLPVLAALALRFLTLSDLTHNLALVSAAVIGLLAPDWWVSSQRSGYLRAVAAGLPDALDMMVICAEAGLGLEPALARVGREIAFAHPAIAAELAQTVSELRLVETSEALANMGARTGLQGLKRVASVLSQTMKYGTPLGHALRVLSAEMRQETMVRFEARAARLPVLLTLPMIFFILPCIFLIVGGPAAIQALQLIHH